MNLLSPQGESIAGSWLLREVSTFRLQLMLMRKQNYHATLQKSYKQPNNCNLTRDISFKTYELKQRRLCQLLKWQLIEYSYKSPTNKKTLYTLINLAGIS